MLERTASALEQCGLRRIFSLSSRSTNAPQRNLRPIFWQHGAAAIELSEAWAAVARSVADAHTTEAEAPSASRATPTGPGPDFLDFLYPSSITAPTIVRRNPRGLLHVQDKWRHSLAPRARPITSSASLRELETSPGPGQTPSREPQVPTSKDEGARELGHDSEEVHRTTNSQLPQQLRADGPLPIFVRQMMIDRRRKVNPENIWHLYVSSSQEQKDTLRDAVLEYLCTHCKHPTKVDRFNPLVLEVDVNSLDQSLLLEAIHTSLRLREFAEAYEYLNRCLEETPSNAVEAVEEFIYFAFSFKRFYLMRDAWRLWILTRSSREGSPSVEILRHLRTYPLPKVAHLFWAKTTESPHLWQVPGFDEDTSAALPRYDRVHSKKGQLDRVAYLRPYSDTEGSFMDYSDCSDAVADCPPPDGDAPVEVEGQPSRRKSKQNAKRVRSAEYWEAEIPDGLDVDAEFSAIWTTNAILGKEMGDFYNSAIRLALSLRCTPRREAELLAALDDPSMYAWYMVHCVDEERVHHLPEIYKSCRKRYGSRMDPRMFEMMFEILYPKASSELVALHGDFCNYYYSHAPKSPGSMAYLDPKRWWAEYMSRAAVYDFETGFKHTHVPFVTMFAKYGDEEMAKAAEADLQQKLGIPAGNIDRYRKVKELCEAGRYEEAIKRSKTQTAQEEGPDNFTLWVAMATAAKARDLDYTLTLFDMAKKDNRHLSAGVLKPVIEVMGSFELLEEAGRTCYWAMDSGLKDVSVPNTMLRIYASRYRLEDTYLLMKAMSDRDIAWDDETYLLLVKVLSSVRKVSEAYALIEKALERNLFRLSRHFFEAVMGGALKTHQYGRVHALAKELEEEKLHVSLNTMSMLARATHRWREQYRDNPEIVRPPEALTSHKSLVKYLAEVMPASSGTPEKLNLATYTLGEVSDPKAMDEFQKIFKAAKGRMTPGMMSAMMMYYLTQGQHDMVRRRWETLFEFMLKKGAASPDEKSTEPPDRVKPGFEYSLDVAFDKMRQVCTRERNPHELLHVLNQVTSAGFFLGRKNWNLTIQALAAGGRWKEAFQLCEEVLMPNWRGWKHMRMYRLHLLRVRCYEAARLKARLMQRREWRARTGAYRFGDRPSRSRRAWWPMGPAWSAPSTRSASSVSSVSSLSSLSSRPHFSTSSLPPHPPSDATSPANSSADRPLESPLDPSDSSPGLAALEAAAGGSRDPKPKPRARRSSFVYTPSVSVKDLAPDAFAQRVAATSKKPLTEEELRVVELEHRQYLEDRDVVAWFLRRQYNSRQRRRWQRRRKIKGTSIRLNPRMREPTMHPHYVRPTAQTLELLAKIWVDIARSNQWSEDADEAFRFIRENCPRTLETISELRYSADPSVQMWFSSEIIDYPRNWETSPYATPEIINALQTTIVPRYWAYREKYGWLLRKDKWARLQANQQRRMEEIRSERRRAQDEAARRWAQQNPRAARLEAEKKLEAERRLEEERMLEAKRVAEAKRKEEEEQARVREEKKRKEEEELERLREEKRKEWDMYNQEDPEEEKEEEEEEEEEDEEDDEDDDDEWEDEDEDGKPRKPTKDLLKMEKAAKLEAIKKDKERRKSRAAGKAAQRRKTAAKEGKTDKKEKKEKKPKGGKKK